MKAIIRFLLSRFTVVEILGFFLDLIVSLLDKKKANAIEETQLNAVAYQIKASQYAISQEVKNDSV
jgi:hypothetical protein